MFICLCQMPHYCHIGLYDNRGNKPIEELCPPHCREWSRESRKEQENWIHEPCSVKGLYLLSSLACSSTEGPCTVWTKPIKIHTESVFDLSLYYKEIRLLFATTGKITPQNGPSFLCIMLRSLGKPNSASCSFNDDLCLLMTYVYGWPMFIANGTSFGDHS